MPCSYCGASLNSSTSCRSNPFSDFHVGTESDQERYERHRSLQEERERQLRCSWCNQPKNSPTACTQNPFSDYHV